MATHHTLISGTAYKITGGSVLIAGTKYQIGGGTAEVAGTKMRIPFSSGVPLSTTTPGEILMLNEGGSLVPFYIAKHDYESGLNGAGRTLLVRKDCSDEVKFSDRSNTYANKNLDTWLCNTYLKRLDADIQTIVNTTTFYYTKGGSNHTVTTLQRAVFQLSLTELGKTDDGANTEGTALPIASTLQIAYLNGSSINQWTRTPWNGGSTQAYYIRKDGDYAYSGCSNYIGSRPAFTLPGTLGVEQNADGTYSIAENTK